MTRWARAAWAAALLASSVLAVASSSPGDGRPVVRSEVASTPDDGSPSPALPFANPAWIPGYSWKYDSKMDYQGFKLDGNVTTMAETYSSVTFGNRTYLTLKITTTGGGQASGNVGGFPINGPWSTASVIHVARNTTDELQVEQTVVIQNTAPQAKITVYSISNYTPALMNLKWPMDSGDAWTHSGEEARYNWTLLEAPPPIGTQYLEAPNSTVSNLSLNFKATGPVYKVVPAGTFLSLKVGNGSQGRAEGREPGLLSALRGLASLPALAAYSKADQPFPGQADQYYSDAAGNSVQFELMDNGTTTGWINLTSTNYPPPPTKYGAQGGLVRDQVGNALVGAKVTAVPATGPSATAYSASTGRFEFTNLVPSSTAGQYSLTANLSGFVDASATATVQASPAQNADVILVLRLPTGTLSVATQDAGGAALGNVSLRIVGVGVDRTNSTDASGNFSAELGIGLYDVTASMSGYKPATAAGLQVKVGEVTTTTLKLEKILGSMTGSVRDSDGVGIAGAKVELRSGGVVADSVLTDQNGVYKTKMLDPGGYEVVVTAATYNNAYDNVTIEGGKVLPKSYVLQKVPPPPVDTPGGPGSMPLYGAIAGAVIAALAVALLLMMRSKRKKREEAARQSAGRQQW